MNIFRLPLTVLDAALSFAFPSQAVTRAHQGFAWPEPTAAERELQAREEAEEVHLSWPSVSAASTREMNWKLATMDGPSGDVSDLPVECSQCGDMTTVNQFEIHSQTHDGDSAEVQLGLARIEIDALNDRLTRYRQAYWQATGNYLAI